MFLEMSLNKQVIFNTIGNGLILLVLDEYKKKKN